MFLSLFLQGSSGIKSLPGCSAGAEYRFCTSKEEPIDDTFKVHAIREQSGKVLISVLDNSHDSGSGDINLNYMGIIDPFSKALLMTILSDSQQSQKR